jgi:fatty-acyl-CoA synthase
VSHPAGGALDYETLVAGSSEAPVDRAVGMDDVCLLPHTSGTTGAPKRILLTHANVTWNVVNFLSCADFRSDDVTPAIAPFFRVGGVGVNVLPVLFMGGTVIVPTEGAPDEILALMERHRVTVGFGNPDSLDALTRAERWPTADLSSVRFIMTGGAPVPERLIRTYLDRGVTMQQGYGLSEAAPLALLLDPGDALRKLGSAGKPPLLVDVRVADVRGENVPPGATGELLVRGPNVMLGYRNQPEATRRALSPEGWLRTGDAARIDEEGFVWIVDRVADAIALEDRTVYPGDVERALAEHPAVAEAGVTSAAGGLVALVVLGPGAGATEDDLVAFVRDRLAPHEIPGAVQFVDHLPRSSVGKLLRADLRALAERPVPGDVSRPAGS